jgi:anti-sigma factor RsiW
MSGEDPTGVRREELSAYVDGELDPERRRIVERHLADHPEDAARVAAYRLRDDSLRLALAEPAASAASAMRIVRRPPTRAPARAAWWRAAAAALVAAVLAGGFWWRQGDGGEGRALAAIAHDATVAHLMFGVADTLAGSAVDAAHLSTALAAVTAGRGRVPDLSPFGFRLAAGRELPAETGPAVLLTYVDAMGRHLSCYFTEVEPDGETPFLTQSASGIETTARLDDGVGYAVVGSLTPAELSVIATAGYAQSLD